MGRASSARSPRVAIWHGTSDYVVRPTNATQLVRQWTAAHRLLDAPDAPDAPDASDAPDATERVGPAEHTTHRDAAGANVVEQWRIDGMSHGVALDAKNDCGAAGAYLLDVGLCSTTKTAAFFGLAPGASSPSGTRPSKGTPLTPTTPRECE